MAATADEAPFVFTVIDVVKITGRGTAVIGSFSGFLEDGIAVSICRGNRVVATGNAIYAPIRQLNDLGKPTGNVGLCFSDYIGDRPKSGDTVQRTDA